LNPYELTQEILEKLSGIKISTSLIQKVTNKVGNELIKQEDDFILKPKSVKKKEIADKIVISMDGAMINTYNDWKEVKTGAIYEIKETEKGLISDNKTYVSKIEDHLSFRKRIKAEAIRRDYKSAKETIVIGDGARWIWDLADVEFPFAVKILDWYHAKEHLNKIVKLLYPADFKESKCLADILENNLYEGNIEELIKIIDKHKSKTTIYDRLEDLADLQTETEYFVKNKDKMQYRYFDDNKYPIGSGVIEGACKQVVQVRLKRNGMKWKNDGAHSVLKIRTMYLSDRWGEVINILKKIA